MDARPFILPAIAALLALTSSPASSTEALDFNQVFNGRGEPASSHYVAMYRLADGEHRVEVWRDRDLHLRRRTDDAVETFVTRPPGMTEWSMVVLDLKRRIRTDVDRTSLYRIGHFTDWFALAHSLVRPAGPYELVPLPHGAQPDVTPIGACRWYLLVQGSRTNKICWSAAQSVPLVIADGDNAIRWKLTAIDARAHSARIFVIDDRGFAHNSANKEVAAD